MRRREDLQTKYESEGLDNLKQDRIEECLANLKKIPNSTIKNKVCKKLANTYAKEGKIEVVKKIIFESPLQDSLWHEAGLTFALNNYIEEAITSIGNITNNGNSAWKRLIEVLIEKKKFSEAEKHLWHLDEESRYLLEKQINPTNGSNKGYWSKELQKGLTLEELTQEIIKQYATARTKEMGEGEATRKWLANQFYQLPFETQSQMLSRYIKIRDVQEEEELNDVLNCLKDTKSF